MNDPERFLTEYCQVIGTPAHAVHIVQIPVSADPEMPMGKLTGKPLVVTEVTVRVGTDTLVATGTDLAEGLSDMMARLHMRTHLLPDIITELSTVSGVRVSEQDYLAAYPVAAQLAAHNEPFDPYCLVGHGCVGEYELMLLCTEDRAVPPLLYAEGSAGQREFHLIPLSAMSGEGRHGLRQAAGNA